MILYLFSPLYSQITKLQNMITYPLYDLDVSEFIPFKDPNTCYLYDLYGVVVSTPNTF